jgi:acetyl-CoA synthetase
MSVFNSGSDIVWRPAPDLVAASQLQRFMSAHGIEELSDLQRRSIDDPRWFWNAVLADLGIEFFRPYDEVMDTSAGLPWTRWCVGGEMNLVHNCLDKRIGTAGERRPAVRWTGEDGGSRILTYGELWREVNRAANALRRLGFGKGDVIGLCMPMLPEIAIAFFAIIKMGAIVMPLFSGYGAEALATRLADAGAAGLITADGGRRKGQTIAMKSVADDAAGRVPSIRHVIVVRHLGDVHRAGAAGSVLLVDEPPMRAPRDVWWDEIVAVESTECETARTSADEPFMLIYTSGTTGRPKGAVHTHCGFPIKAAQDMQQGFDMRAEDTLFWVTDMGWMMGPWELLGATILGAAIALYEGAIDYPSSDRLWRLVEEHRVSVLGVSPTLIRVLMHAGDAAVDGHDLSSLRILGSTGEPWNPDPWRWLFEKIGKSRLPIINYSGGTEISGGILSGNVLTPMKACSFSGPLPGMAADVLDDRGHPVRGRVGELVVRQPWIGMTRGFWKDPDRYVQTYWSTFPNLWVHGDWAVIDEDGLWYILGRSDDTLKIAGKRLGPAEIESVLVSHPAVQEAAAIGVPDEIKGERLICFCVLKPDTTAGLALEQELKDWVKRAMGNALKPEAIRFVDELPKTRNGKVMRRLIRAIYIGEDPGDVSALDEASRGRLQNFAN